MTMAWKPEVLHTHNALFDLQQDFIQIKKSSRSIGTLNSVQEINQCGHFRAVLPGLHSPYFKSLLNIVGEYCLFMMGVFVRVFWEDRLEAGWQLAKRPRRGGAIYNRTHVSGQC